MSHTTVIPLRRPEGGTVAQIANATGWAQHTVRGFFAGLKKKVYPVEVKSRERMGRPNKTRAKGSFTITLWRSEAPQPQHRTSSEAPEISHIPGALASWLHSDTA